MKDYGNAIKILRKRNSMTQAALAEKLNVSGQAVSKWENNIAQPDLDTVLKMAELFGVTLNEFFKLCETDTVDATPTETEVAAAEVAQAPVSQSTPMPMLIGVCSQCGSSIYEEKNVGVRTPKLLCKRCLLENERRMQETKKQDELEEAKKRKHQRTKLRRSLIFPGITASLVFIFLMIGSPIDFGLWLFLCAWGYGIAVLIRWDNNLIAAIFENTFGRTFAKPGLIIPLSLDGFLWALGVKLVMAVIWFFLSAFVTLCGLGLCMLLLPFVLPFAIRTTRKEMKANRFMR